MRRHITFVAAVVMSMCLPQAAADNGTYKSYNKDADVYVLGSGGSVTRLSDRLADQDWDGYPDWSPDGKRIAFNRFPGSPRGTDSEIYVMASDGSGNYNFSAAAGCDLEPAWSPDGTAVAFHGSRGQQGIQVRAVDRREEVALTSGNDHFPAWSPDGTRIAYARYPGSESETPSGDAEIWIVNLGDGQIVRLATHAEFPSWSPDGSQITFASFDADPDIYVINADGTNLRRLTNSPGLNTDPDWGGTQIVFTSERDGNAELYVMSADGSGQTRLTNNPGFDGYPVWSPDGSRIAFTSERSAETPTASRQAQDRKFRPFASQCRE
jgi:Tol biopolymer transport system component